MGGKATVSVLATWWSFSWLFAPLTCPDIQIGQAVSKRFISTFEAKSHSWRHIQPSFLYNACNTRLNFISYRACRKAIKSFINMKFDFPDNYSSVALWRLVYGGLLTSSQHILFERPFRTITRHQRGGLSHLSCTLEVWEPSAAPIWRKRWRPNTNPTLVKRTVLLLDKSNGTYRMLSVR